MFFRKNTKNQVFLKKIFSSVCLTISLLLLIYTFYKSEIHWNGLNRGFYLTYYIISFLLIIFSIITFFINQKIKEYLIISLVSIIVSLYTFEGYLTFKGQLSKKLLKEQLYEKETGEKYDKRIRKEIYEDLKKINNKIKVSVFPNRYLANDYKLFPCLVLSFGALRFQKVHIEQYFKN